MTPTTPNEGLADLVQEFKSKFEGCQFYGVDLVKCTRDELMAITIAMSKHATNYLMDRPEL